MLNAECAGRIIQAHFDVVKNTLIVVKMNLLPVVTDVVAQWK